MGFPAKMRGELKTRFRTEAALRWNYQTPVKRFQSRLEGAGMLRRDFEQRPAERAREVVVGLG